MFAYGEGQSKRTLAGIIFGVGMAIGAVKFTGRNFTIADLIAAGMLTGDQAATLTESVRVGKNILIAGATSTGKTTLLNVLADPIQIMSASLSSRTRRSCTFAKIGWGIVAGA